jgi:hypothetical protein
MLNIKLSISTLSKKSEETLCLQGAKIRIEKS